jgi:hypothetical protein
MNLKFVKFAAYMALIVGLSASAFASCGDSLSAMVAGAVAVGSQPRPTQHNPQTSADKPANSSIVGLWYVQFVVGTETIQTAYQLWNAGGTEIHNPSVDPRSGNVCLGVWKQTAPKGAYRLAHRVWNWDTSGDYLGTINLSESVTLSQDGNMQNGSFVLDFYDPNGVFQTAIPGTVIAQRISVE